MQNRFVYPARLQVSSFHCRFNIIFCSAHRRKKHGDSPPFQLHCPDCRLPFNSPSILAVSVVEFFSASSKVACCRRMPSPMTCAGTRVNPSLVDDIFSCRQMKRMRKWLSKAMPKYQHQPQTMKSLAQTAANFSSLQVLIFLSFWQHPTRKKYSSQYIIQLHCLLVLTRIS